MILTYFIIVILVLVSIFRNKEVVLFRGINFLKFNILFAAIALTWLGMRSEISINTLWFPIVIFIVGLFLKNFWVLFKHTLPITGGIIESSLALILAPYEKKDYGYNLNLKDGLVKMTIYNFGLNIAIITFDGAWHQKKVEVLQALLKKKFGSIFPKLVIHLKDKNVKSN